MANRLSKLEFQVMVAYLIESGKLSLADVKEAEKLLSHGRKGE